MRIASCGQLLGGLRLRIHSGGEIDATRDFAGRYLRAQLLKTARKEDAEEFWDKVLKSLKDQQRQARRDQRQQH
ncbi:hypothetical protein CPB84DRAFT_1765933 [Gymnopilus junonius]|uniref:Uncharacterized protein n=1 Tax=Gymnopilus junonius TaxID=109634 RepID=A0A9P5TTC8_GYMJU|nr:hypothetical protein CPB84DRAFT_1765933 [Gymnopilus junonius]